MHGGDIEARSAGAGEGSEFLIRLPLAAAQESEAAIEGGDAGTIPKTRILVVDDNRDAAESLSMVLQSLGADVRVARDGPEAIAAFAAYDPSFVLLDIGMPGMDGYEVARRLRTRFPDRRASIIALTGWGQEEDRRQAREAGFDYHLIKPVEVNVLQTLLATLAQGTTPTVDQR